MIESFLDGPEKAGADSEMLQKNIVASSNDSPNLLEAENENAENTSNEQNTLNIPLRTPKYSYDKDNMIKIQQQWPKHVSSHTDCSIQWHLEMARIRKGKLGHS